MSEQVTEKGKLRPVAKGPIPVEDYVRELCKDKEIPYYYESQLEYVLGEFDEEYYFHKDTCTLYKIEDRKDVEDSDIFELERNPDGTLSYLTSFYNGGCSFGEALDYAFEKLSKKRYNPITAEALLEKGFEFIDYGQDSPYKAYSLKGVEVWEAGEDGTGVWVIDMLDQYTTVDMEYTTMEDLNAFFSAIGIPFM